MCEFFLCPSASEARRANVCTEAVCLLHDEHRPGATRPTLAGRERRGYSPARRFTDLGELDGQYGDWRDRTCNRRTHASGRFPVDERLAEERCALRPLSPLRFDWSGHCSTRVPLDGYLRHGGSFYRAP